MKFSVAAGFLLVSTALAHGDHQLGHHPHMHAMNDGPHHQHRLEQHEQGGGMMHPGDHDSLRPHTHVAYHHVEKACASDVETLCTRQEFPDTFGDPFLDWMLLPSATLPVDDVEDIEAVMDRMMETILLSPQYTTTITFFAADFDIAPEESSVQDINFVVDSTAAKLATETQPEEIPELALQLQTYGHELMMRAEEGNPEHHLGRRLTEMDANTLQHHVRLPFGFEQNTCLMNALQQSKVSADCAHSIQQLQNVNALETDLEHRQDLLFMSAYLVLLMVVLIMAVKKAKQNKLRHLLGYKILQAIYSNPELKRQVEEELGESVGHTPPVPSFALKMMGAGGRKLKRKLKRMRRVHLTFLLLVAYMIVAAPGMVWPLFVMAMFARVLFMCVVVNKPSTADECKCCCCGATTTNAALGALTEVEQCCNCCKGTGVCSPNCMRCCGGCCCCGGKGCCCCSNACCCCGATPEQSKAGELTAEQESCSCCNGTAKCCPSCASCCGGGGCCGPSSPPVGQGQKHVFQSHKAVFHGVPVQIV